MFFTNWVGADVVNPVVNISISGKGRGGGWFGWPDDPKMEALRDAFARSSSSEEQKKLADQIQKENYDEVIYVPLGQYLIPSAWRTSLKGVLDGPATPIFWNIDKSE
jgi:peptide/nickel transport system substrate-binding protein